MSLSHRTNTLEGCVFIVPELMVFTVFFVVLIGLRAHSFPPSSLDRRCFMFIVSPKKVVGCRGGNQNVEGDLLTFG